MSSRPARAPAPRSSMHSCRGRNGHEPASVVTDEAPRGAHTAVSMRPFPCTLEGIPEAACHTIAPEAFTRLFALRRGRRLLGAHARANSTGWSSGTVEGCWQAAQMNRANGEGNYKAACWGVWVVSSRREANDAEPCSAAMAIRTCSPRTCQSEQSSTSTSPLSSLSARASGE